MFGITNPADAVTAGTIMGAAILALCGRRAADWIKGTPAVEAAAFPKAFDADAMNRVCAALESIALCLKTMLEDQRDEHKREMDERLERIEKKLSGSPKGPPQDM